MKKSIEPKETRACYGNEIAIEVPHKYAGTSLRDDDDGPANQIALAIEQSHNSPWKLDEQLL
jgi:hypothetical protein